VRWYSCFASPSAAASNAGARPSSAPVPGSTTWYSSSTPTGNSASPMGLRTTNRIAWSRVGKKRTRSRARARLRLRVRVRVGVRGRGVYVRWGAWRGRGGLLPQTPGQTGLPDAGAHAVVLRGLGRGHRRLARGERGLGG